MDEFCEYKNREREERKRKGGADVWKTEGIACASTHS